MNTAQTKSRVHISGVVQNAVLFDFKNRRGNNGAAALSMESLLQTVEELFALLQTRQIDYLLVGGIAIL